MLNTELYLACNAAILILVTDQTQSLVRIAFHKILPRKDNFFVMLHLHVCNSLQKVFELFKRILHTSIISESIKCLVKEY